MLSRAERVEEGVGAQEFYERQDEFPHRELIDGEVWPMVPTMRRHGKVEGRIFRLLDEWIEKRGHGEAVCGEVGYQLAGDLVRAADVAVHLDVPEEKPGWETVVPELIVEVVSPSDTWAAMEQKVEQWLAAGVSEVWVVDPDSRTVTVRMPDGGLRTYRGDAVLETALLPGFRATLGRIFS